MGNSRKWEWQGHRKHPMGKYKDQWRWSFIKDRKKIELWEKALTFENKNVDEVVPAADNVNLQKEKYYKKFCSKKSCDLTV